MAFVKLHGEILNSSIWLEDQPTRLLWITLLAMADENGVVQASVGGLAHRARISREECEAGIAVLTGPDPDSRDGTTGERIEKVPGGWLVLNHANYRDRQTDAQAKTAARVAKHRAAKKARSVTGNDTGLGNDLSPSEAEAEADTEAPRPVGAAGWLAGPGTSVPTGQGEGPRSGTRTEPATPERTFDPDETGVFDTLGREFSRQVLDPLLRYGAEVGADGVLEFRTGEMHDDQPREIGEPRFPPGDVPGWLAFYVRIV